MLQTQAMAAGTGSTPWMRDGHDVAVLPASSTHQHVTVVLSWNSAGNTGSTSGSQPARTHHWRPECM